MSLNRTKDNRVLCNTCFYDADNSCIFPKRPHATSCTLYQNAEQKTEGPTGIERKPLYPVPWWQKINQLWLALGILIAVSMLIAIF